MTDPVAVKYVDQYCVKTGDMDVSNICYDGQVTLSCPVFNGELGIDQTATMELEFSYDGEIAWIHNFPNNLLSNEDYIYATELIEQAMEQAHDFLQLAEKYGFKGNCQSSKLHLCAQNTDGKWTPWISYNGQTNSVSCRGNTDHLNIWLCNTRKDMTPEKCVSFVNELNAFFALTDKNRFSVRQLIDPEDWQDIAEVRDAYLDERYSEPEKKSLSEQIQALTNVDDYGKQMIAESLAKKQSIDFRLVQPLLFDDFGNRKSAFEVNVFDKCSDGSWRQTEQLSTLSGSFYVLGEGQDKTVYSEINGRLYPMNMDFYSYDCHRCYSVGQEVPVVHKITGNAVLTELKSQNGAVYKLKRQDYSDTPPFYYFANARGDWLVNHGNRDLNALFDTLKKSFSHDPVLSDGIAKLESSMLPALKPSLDAKIASSAQKAGQASISQERSGHEGR